MLVKMIRSVLSRNIKGLFIFVVSAVLFSVFSVFFVSALSLGIAGDIEAYPGQRIDTVFTIQNLLGDAVDVTMEGIFEEGGEVISFSAGNIFDVSAGGVVDTPVRIQIPSNAAIGTEYLVTVLFRTVEGETDEDGNVQFLTNVRRNFKIIVVTQQPAEEVEEAQPEGVGGVGNFWLWGIGIIFLIIIIWLVLKRKSSSAVPVVKDMSQ